MHREYPIIVVDSKGVTMPRFGLHINKGQFAVGWQIWRNVWTWGIEVYLGPVTLLAVHDA